MPRKSLLVIGYTWPEPTSTAAGNRILQLLRFFLEQNYTIVFASTANETELSYDLSVLGVEKAHILLNDSSFDKFIADLNPEIVLFDRFLTEEQFGWRVAEFAPQAIRVLDTEDLHSLRNTRENLFKKETAFTEAAWLQSDMTKREIASIFRCDLSLIISSFEMDLLEKVVKINADLLLHLPFMLPKIDRKQIGEWMPFSKRKNLVCIGNGRHAPNVDAIKWLKQEIWPKIAACLPDAKLIIYGAYLPEHILRLHNPKERFLIAGWAENADEFMQAARVNLVPLRFGAGIKGKLVLAMQMGTPSVTTPIGAEGMHKGLPWSGTIADDGEDFANAAVELYENEMIWREAQQKGIEIINRNYEKERLAKHMATRLQDLRSHLQEHRSQNFIGAMLYLQTMQATKYLSRWIELKNSKD